MKWKVLVSAPYMQPILGRFQSELEEKGVELVVPPVLERLEEIDLLNLMTDIDGVICGDDRFTRKVIESSPKLKVLSKWGTGIDSLDADACAERGVVICRNPNAFSTPVAESVLGYILCFTRKLLFMDRLMHRGIWEKIPGRVLEECTLGVIGVGDSGKAVASRARALGMKVLGNDIKEMPQEFIELTDIRMVTKEQLLQEADFVSLHTDLNTTSFHLMNRERFALMRPDAYLLNLSRGPVVDEEALVEALIEERISGAALDVFEVEPPPLKSQLLKMDNVLLAPHNANSSALYWERVHRNTIDNLMAVLEKSE
ncbi:phosphoglycerate dehydrogenase [Desulfofustis glycolicus]|uniref:D-3-phosphoglycerate dehydrogenase n=1 Tax=Desulfofustis glycolicus DSM 9705 TaxID=1121409 RepID=A0A1M5TZN1_9BACT|nr:phosphoglycerate dehydrogenase [Desulfofustis glycolicus]SHH56076.1 D-3-phosphoglycerate dehydrogenase [Desulfofustis glycolicus DSM 9705]